MKLILFLLLSLNLVLQASPIENFNKRFVMVKNDAGQLQYIKAKGVTNSFNLNLYVTNLKKEIISLRDDLFSASVGFSSHKNAEFIIDRRISSFLDEVGLEDQYTFGANKSYQEMTQKRSTLQKALKNLVRINLKKAFAELDKKGVISNFVKEMNKYYQHLDVSVVAQPNNAKFYYRKKIANKVFKTALNFAKKKINNIPYLDLATFIFFEAEKRVVEQRIISQNILLYYLSNHEDQTGLSAEEVDKVVSSIYESRIGFEGYMESKKAQKTWGDYGWKIFDAMTRGSKAKAKNYQQINGDLSELDFIFYNGYTVKNEKVIYNLSVNAHQFSSKPSISFYYDKPNKVRSLRAMIKLGQIGLGFLPRVPAMIKNQVHNFANSWHVKQSLSDAFLYAYFEASENEKDMKFIKNQISNPYLKL